MSPPTVVLLVDDNEMNRDLLSRRLRTRDFEVIVAVNGEQAIHLAEIEQPGVILMDMTMPVLDGWEATRRLKENPRTQAIPIIGVSSHAMDTDVDKSMRAGCDDYITKPVHFDRLIAAIGNVVDRKNSA